MLASALRFVRYEDSSDEANVVIDGSPNAGTVLTLSHWPGLAAPPGCAADTSAQMAFRYLDRGADLHDGAEAVTNNHFDQDGLAGAYALVFPDEGLRRRAQLEGLACAGDFGVAPDRDVARLSMAVATLADRSRSPLGPLPPDDSEACASLYIAALELLPDWLGDVGTCRTLWVDEDAELERGIQSLASGAVSIDEDPRLDLAVVTLATRDRSAGHRFAGRTFHGIHPIALHSATERSTILIVDPIDGRHHLTCRYEGWVQFQSRRIRPRADLRPLAEHLSTAESEGALWVATPPGDLTPELSTVASGAPSSLDPSDVLDAVQRHLNAAEPAWDPYAVRR